MTESFNNISEFQIKLNMNAVSAAYLEESFEMFRNDTINLIDISGWQIEPSLYRHIHYHQYEYKYITNNIMDRLVSLHNTHGLIRKRVYTSDIYFNKISSDISFSKISKNIYFVEILNRGLYGF